MALPSGYTKLEYIESSGTQYINTGVRNFSTQFTRVVLDVDWLSGVGCYFGFNHSTTLRWFANAYSSTSIHSGYMEENKSATVSTVIGRYTVDKNGSSTTVNGVKIQHNSADTTISGSILLLALGIISGVTDIADAARIYSCEISSASISTGSITIERKFVPCKTPSGEVGLYDEANDVFYNNAGTGTFIAGPEVSSGGSSNVWKHKTLIAGTSYSIKNGKTLIGGTGYGIKKGRTLIGGTGYNISFDTSIGELDEGTIVKINESGSPVEFYIAKHNYESDLNGLGRTLVVRKFCHSNRQFVESYSGCSFFESSIIEWLNSTYRDYLDAFIKTAISGDNNIHTQIKYTNDYIRPTTATGTCAIFLLSVAEIDTSNATAHTPYTDGSILPIADVLKIAYDSENTAVKQWTRSWTHSRGPDTCIMTATGTLSNADMRSYSPIQKLGTRPVFTLPAEMKIDDDFNIVPS